MVRCFEDTNIIHVDGNIDPARDIETINLELIFSDIEILDRRIAKISKQARMDKTLAKELELVESIKAHLEAGKMARSFEVPDDDDAQLWFKGLQFADCKAYHLCGLTWQKMTLQMTVLPIRMWQRYVRWQRKKARGICDLCTDRAGIIRAFR